MAEASNLGEHTQLTTDDVPTEDAFEYWRDMICATFVQLAASSSCRQEFAGRIDHSAVHELELSTVTASSQQVDRTARLISASSEEFVLASIQLQGRGLVEQDGRAAELEPGQLAFYDSTRPYTLTFEEDFRQLVVQVPRSQIDALDTRTLTARTLGKGTPGPVVVDFFRSLADAAWEAPNSESLNQLAPHAIGLLSAAASHAARLAPNEDAGDALIRERASRFMLANLGDPHIDADAIAAACAVSRRTLYRIVGEGGVARMLRRLRLQHAQHLLVAEPARLIGAIAAVCGFETESGFHRAFRAATGLSPSEYREQYGTVRQ